MIRWGISADLHVTEAESWHHAHEGALGVSDEFCVMGAMDGRQPSQIAVVQFSLAVPLHTEDLYIVCVCVWKDN